MIVGLSLGGYLVLGYFSSEFGKLLFEIPKNRWGITDYEFVMRLGAKGLEQDDSFPFDMAAE